MRDSTSQRTNVFLSDSSQRLHLFFSSSVSCSSHLSVLIFLDWCLGNSQCSDLLMFFLEKYQQRSFLGQNKILTSFWSALLSSCIYERFPAGKLRVWCWYIFSILSYIDFISITQRSHGGTFLGSFHVLHHSLKNRRTDFHLFHLFFLASQLAVNVRNK